MTIRQRLLANLGITLSFLMICFGLMSWGAYRYSHLQEGVDIVNLQVKGWLTLNFQVSQYMKNSLETILSGKKIAEADIEQLTGEIIHSFIQMEKTARVRKKYLTSAEQEEQRQQLIVVRDQFGLINAELEKAILALNQGQKSVALNGITSQITQAKLDKKFIELIDAALKKEEAHESKIRENLIQLKARLIILFSALVAMSLVLSAFFMLWINRSIQRSIQYAKNELLRGTQSLGSGNLETEIQINTKDELSIVAEAFNKMAKDLSVAWKLIGQQQQQIVSSSKMSALGEMAGGVAHEINTPLAAIKNLSGQLQEVLDDDPLDKALVKDMASQVEKTTNRIAKIVSGLRSFSRDGSKDPFQSVNVQQLIEETLSFCNERFKNGGTQIIIEDFKKDLCFDGRSTEISQVLLNLLNNAHDAISGFKEKWIKVSVVEQADCLDILVTDCGNGVPVEVRDKIFQPFFTTKEIGKGTGMGLSISVGLIKGHSGELKLDTQCPNTRFVVRLPKKQNTALAA